MEDKSEKIEELEKAVKELEEDAANGFASSEVVNGLKKSLELFKAGDKEHGFENMVRVMFLWAMDKM